MTTATERDEAIATIKAQIEKFDLSAVELGLGRTRGAKRAQVPIKYRDSNGNEWTGRGKMATWMTKAIAAGAKKEDFLVAEAAQAATQAAA